MQTVSIIMPTYNSIRTMDACLHSVVVQDYPQIEILAADGGSTDGTLDILKKYNVTIINERTGSPEAAKAIALQHAQGKLILFLPSDNIIPHQKWISNMVKKFDSECIACYPRRYAWRKQDTPLTRYFALLGANDPVAWFLGKADRQSYLDTPISKQVIFTEDTMPTLGDNGFLIRKDVLMKAKVDPQNYFHIDVIFDLVFQAPQKFYIVDDEIIHDTGEKFIPFLKKRYRYMKQLYMQQKNQRRYHVFDIHKDLPKLILFCLYSITLVGPLIYSIRGYLKKQDYAWFLHPLMCIGIMITYAVGIIK